MQECVKLPKANDKARQRALKEREHGRKEGSQHVEDASWRTKRGIIATQRSSMAKGGAVTVNIVGCFLHFILY